MFNFFKKRKQKFPSGVLPDPRPAEERAKDYLTSEILTVRPLEWKDFEEWKRQPENQKMLNELPVYNQNGAGSCVAHSIALITTINNWKEEKKAIKYSARGIYARRKNRDIPGMYFHNAAELFKKYGVVFESVLPSEGLNEEQMNKFDDYLPSFDLVGKVYAPESYFWVSNFAEMVQIIARGIPVQVGVKFGEREWNYVVPQIKHQLPLFELPYGHSVVVLPNAYFGYQGKLAVLIQDSWGISSGWNGRRILTQDWFEKRFIGGLWYEDLNNLQVFNEQLPKPKYQFKRDLEIGTRGYDVAMLQVCLATLKDGQGYLFPLWQGQEPTGYFGGLTRQAVKRFQAMFGIEPVGRVGPQTRAKLNELFG